MVSLQSPISPNSRKTNAEFDNLLKKRKLEEFEGQEPLDKRSKVETTKSIFDIDLHLENPLPLEWERCLDIQSGQIHFYNTRTQKKTSGDPRGSPDPVPEPPNPEAGPMSLDLELNLLPYDSQRKKNQPNKRNSASPPRALDITSKQQKKKLNDLTRCPSWLAFEGDQKEMVATACTRCHMLVMLCKSSPTCPNCKFVHPPDQSPPKLFKQGLSLLC